MENIITTICGDVISSITSISTGRERHPIESIIRGGIRASGPVGLVTDIASDVAEIHVHNAVLQHNNSKQEFIESGMTTKEADLTASFTNNMISGLTYSICINKLQNKDTKLD